MADRLGWSQTGLSAYERGLVPESWAFLKRLRKEFGVDLNDFIAGA
jgi:transcriptional regulator with XRE-family HTH domain